MEYKFRAWDILSKKMLSWEDIMHLPAWEIFPGTPEQRCFKVMQYTGLSDKNGKEIYEGDIVEDSIGFIFAISIFDYHGLRFMFGKDQLNKMHANGGKVIGNKFDNPELLEK